MRDVRTNRLATGFIVDADVLWDAWRYGFFRPTSAHDRVTRIIAACWDDLPDLFQQEVVHDLARWLRENSGGDLAIVSLCEAIGIATPADPDEVERIVREMRDRYASVMDRLAR